MRYLFYVILLTFVSSFIGCNDNRLQNDYNEELKILQKKISELNQNNISIFYNVQQNENLQLDSNLKLLAINRDTVLVKDVFNKDKLILSYRESNCRMCVDAELKILIKNAQKINNEICIIASYKNFRGVIVDKRNLESAGLKNIEIYYLLPNTLKIPIEKQNRPYYFQIDSGLKMTNFFIPKKEEPRLSETYLKFFLKNYKNEI